jgi:hypothetical protein
MTNEELIKKFFQGRIEGNEESYGFSVKPFFMESVGNFALYSKTYHFPMAARASEYYFIVSIPFMRANGVHYLNHSRLVITTAEQLKIRFVLSPQADRANFHKYMEGKINNNLLSLARDLNVGTYRSVLKFKKFGLPSPPYGLAGGPDSCFAVPENYQRLMGNIHTLLEGESILELPKNQVALIDADEVQSLWRWLIKENPDSKDRAILLRIYTLSRLLVNNREPLVTEDRGRERKWEEIEMLKTQ